MDLPIEEVQLLLTQSVTYSNSLPVRDGSATGMNLSDAWSMVFVSGIADWGDVFKMLSTYVAKLGR